MFEKTSETSESKNVGEWSNSMKKSLEAMRLQLTEFVICSYSSNFKNHEIELSFEDDYALLETDEYIYKIKINKLYEYIDSFEGVSVREMVTVREMVLGFLKSISDDVIDKNSNEYKKHKKLELWLIDGIKLLDCIYDDVIDKNSNEYMKYKILELWSIDGIKLSFNGIYAFIEIGDLIHKIKIEILYTFSCHTTPDKLIRNKYRKTQLTLRSDAIINKSGEFVKSRKYDTEEINKYLLAKEEFYNA